MMEQLLDISNKREGSRSHLTSFLRAFFILSLFTLTGIAHAANTYPIAIKMLDKFNYAMNKPDNVQAYIIYGIPAGTSIEGKAQAPKEDDTGNYYQIVDGQALFADELSLVAEDGFFGDVDLKIYAYHGTSEATLNRRVISALNFDIQPDVDYLLFAQSGSIQYNHAKMEMGSTTLTDTINEGVSKTVKFKNTYESPVVVAFINSRNGNDSVDVRVKDVSSTGATLFMQEPDHGSHVSETVSYMVVESGRFTLPDGTKIEAGRHATSKTHQSDDSYSKGDKIKFHQYFKDAPVVLHTLNTQRSTFFTSTIATHVDKDSFRLQKALGNLDFPEYPIFGKNVKMNPEEIIGWVAIEADKSGFINNVPYETGSRQDSGRDGYDDAPQLIKFRDAFISKPEIIVDANTGNGTDSHWARSAGDVEVDSFQVYAEEDGLDGERTHIGEGFFYFAAENKFALDEKKKIIPLDLIVNPLLESFTLRLSSIPSQARLLDSEGNIIALNEGNEISFNSREEMTLLSLDMSDVTTKSNYMYASLIGQYRDETFVNTQTIFLNGTDLEFAANNQSFLRLPSKRSDNKIKRIGNAFEIKLKGTSIVTRVEMVDVDRLVFSDGTVSASQYHEKDTLNASQVAELAGLGENDLIIFSGLPADAAINNSVPLGNGAYGIPASDFNINEPSYDIEYSKHNVSAEFSVSIQTYAMTSEEAEYINGQARISGYANATAFAEAGFDTSMSAGDDGVRAEARAYVQAGAVATAGGSVSVDQVFTASANVEAYYDVKHEISAGIEADADGVYIGVYVGSESNVGIDGSIGVTADFVPGTGFEAGGSAYVSSYAYVKGDHEVAWGDDGNYGLSTNGGVGAGVAAKASGYSSTSLGGVTGGAKGTVKAGLAAGASGGATAMYRDGEVDLGLTGGITLLIGIKIDLTVSVDTSEVEDTGVLIATGFVTGAEAVAEGFIDVTDAVESGYITATTAIRSGFITAEDAIREELISVESAVLTGYISVEDAINEGLISAEDALDEGLAEAEQLANAGIDYAEHYGSEAVNYGQEGLGYAEEGLDYIGDGLCDVFCL